VPFAEGGYTYPAIQYTLEQGGKHEDSILLGDEWYEPNLKTGKYRVVKEIKDDEDEEVDVTLAAYFTIKHDRSILVFSEQSLWRAP
jgi:hypothetical protein